MSAEWLTAVSALLTLFVVGVTAYAALRQIKHMRSGNQVAALLPLAEKYQTPDIQESLQYVMNGSLRRDLEDPAARRGAENVPASGVTRKAMTVMNFYESVGALVAARVLDLELVLRYFTLPSDMWQLAGDYIAITRRKRGPDIFENFEAMVAMERRYTAKHGSSLYPKGLPRIPVADSYGVEDAAPALELVE